jgi:hypothetical protein
MRLDREQTSWLAEVESALEACIHGESMLCLESVLDSIEEGVHSRHHMDCMHDRC